MILWIDNNNLLSVYFTKQKIVNSYVDPFPSHCRQQFKSALSHQICLFHSCSSENCGNGQKKVQSIIYVSLLCECQISFSLKYVSVWHRKTTRPKLHPFHFYFNFTWRKKMQIFSFQLHVLFLTSIHVNSLFKFIINDQETSWRASDWTVSKWPLLYVIGFCVVFHRSIFIVLLLLALIWHDLKWICQLGYPWTSKHAILLWLNRLLPLSHFDNWLASLITCDKQGRVRLP